MKRILITGGAGFIGSGLTLKLLQAGNSVTTLDNYYTGNTKNLDSCREFHGFKELRHDVVDPYPNEKTGDSDVEFDQIYHLACPASPVHYQSNPVKTMLTSVKGTHHFLELARKTGAKLLFASTSEVYGDPKEHPQKEEYRGFVNPHGIRACYDEGKRAGEALCFDYYRQYDTRVKVVRIFNTYGENMNPEDGRVVSNFITQAINGKNLTTYGDGTQTRSFCYVQDLIDGIISMMEDESDWLGPVNLGNPNEITVNQLVEAVLRLTNTNNQVVYHPLPEDDPVRRCPDITLAKERLGWEPRVSLDEGLSKTIEYFKSATS